MERIWKSFWICLFAQSCLAQFNFNGNDNSIFGSSFPGFGSSNGGFGFPQAAASPSPATNGFGSPQGSIFGSNFGSPSSFGSFGSSPSIFSGNPSQSASPSPQISGGMGVLSSNSGRRATAGGQTGITAGSSHGTQSDTRNNPDGSQVTNTRVQPMRFTFGGFGQPGQTNGNGGNTMFGTFNFGGNSPFGSQSRPAPAPSQASPVVDTNQDRERFQDRSPAGAPRAPNNSPISFGGGASNPFGSFGGGDGGNIFGNNAFAGNNGFGGFGNNGR